MPTYLFTGLVILLAYIGFNLYNLIRRQRDAKKSWDNVNIRMNMRHGLLHELLTICKQCHQFEPRAVNAIKDACESVHSASMVGDAQALGDAESYLRDEMEKVFNTAEAYPETRANEALSTLLKDIAKLNATIAKHGSQYDALAISNNDLLETFPTSLFASLFGYSFKPRLAFKIKKGGNASSRPV